MLARQSKIFLCDTEDAKKLAFQIRYQVYCEETGWEDSAKFPNKMEQDEYDDSSVHFLIGVPENGQWIGTSRLVIGESGFLPFRQLFDQLEAPVCLRSNSAEISRLCIKDEFRRSVKGVSSASGPKGLPVLMLKLLNALHKYALDHNIGSLFALQSEALAKLLTRIGFNFEKAAAAIDHRGLRSPYFAHVGSLMSKVDSNPFYQRCLELDKQQPYYLFSEYLEDISQNLLVG